MNFVDTNVKAVFYTSQAAYPIRTHIGKLFLWSNVSHSAILFTQGDKKYIYVMNPKGGKYLISLEKYEWFLKMRDIKLKQKVVDLGSVPISLHQLSYYLDRPKFKIAPLYEQVFWWLIGRHLSKTYQPMTCALTASYLLRICGFKVDLHIAPHSLYKEIRNGVDNHFRSSPSGEDIVG